MEQRIKGYCCGMQNVWFNTGEDKLFLNVIFLRLTDAFRLGNKEIKTRCENIC